MTNNNAFAEYVKRIREVQKQKVWCDGEMAEIYRSARRARLNVAELKDIAKALHAEIKNAGDAALQVSAVEQRAKEVLECPDELKNYGDGLFPPLKGDISMDDLCGLIEQAAISQKRD